MSDTDEAKPGGLRNMAPWVWRRGQIMRGLWSCDFILRSLGASKEFKKKSHRVRFEFNGTRSRWGQK